MSKVKSLKPELVAYTTRGDNIETLHTGWICVLSQDKKIIYKKGNIHNNVFLRSALKPIQATPIIDYNLDISQKELALASGSHSGSKDHLSTLNTFMKKNDLHLSDLKCGITPPFDEKEKNRLLKANRQPAPLHNNCSGKHLGMLAVCKKNNWNLKTYLSPDHLLHKAILKNIKYLSEAKNISVAVDGCGLPIYSLPLINIAKMYSNFTNKKNKKYLKIIQAMCSYPVYIGGKNQIDTEIIKASHGRLIAKVGAEGIIIVAADGNSIVLKIADGAQKVRSFVILNLLIRLGWLKAKELRNSPLEEILKGNVKNHVGRNVGKLVCVI